MGEIPGGDGLRVELLGPVRAWRGDQELALGPAQQRTLFALLALAGSRPVTRTDIVDGLWPAGAPSAATNVVQTYIKRLRRCLEPERTRRTPSVVLPAVGDGYALFADADLHDFRTRVRAARAGTDPATRARLLGAAVRLWVGQPLAGTALAESTAAYALTAERDQAVCWYAEAALRAELADEATPVVETVVRSAQLHEHMHALLIRLQQAVGRRSAAFATFLDIRARLAEDLGVAPGPDLAAAHAALLDPGVSGANGLFIPAVGL